MPFKTLLHVFPQRAAAKQTHLVQITISILSALAGLGSESQETATLRVGLLCKVRQLLPLKGHLGSGWFGHGERDGQAAQASAGDSDRPPLLLWRASLGTTFSVAWIPYCRGVNLIFTGGHIRLTVAFKELNVILGLYKCNYSLTRGKELGAAAR